MRCVFVVPAFASQCVIGPFLMTSPAVSGTVLLWPVHSVVSPGLASVNWRVASLMTMAK
jgi:hypothetical protein